MFQLLNLFLHANLINTYVSLTLDQALFEAPYNR